MRAENYGRTGIVVSAMSKVTDALVELANLARLRDSGYVSRADALKSRHIETAEDLLPPEGRQTLLSTLESDFRDIKEVLRGVYLSRSHSDPTIELISGYGEIWSAQLLNAYLNAEGIVSNWLDARTVLTVEPGGKNVSVDWVAFRSANHTVARKPHD